MWHKSYVHLGTLTQSQIRYAKAVDRWLGPPYSTNGSWDFAKLLEAYLRPGLRVYDVGSGKRPAIDAATKTRLGLRVVGIDISRSELDRAPAGCYDAAYRADICEMRGTESVDLVIAKAVIEHVPDTKQAFAAIASMLKPGGLALLFVPCRNAIFARVNLLLPERVKLRLLSLLAPGSGDHVGFPAHYDRCTPRQFRKLAAANGLEFVEERLYLHHNYLHQFLPLHVAWRCWNTALSLCSRSAACQSFAVVLRKQ
jgi:2-polyprenyl-6-hydroxyphenyl methylase/3-demethylubiquinone-9 3-methyltransferase